MVPRQFSLRSVFLVTAVVAVASFLATKPNILLAALSVLPFAAGGCVLGALAGRITGTDWIDATIGGMLGTAAGIFVWLAMPSVQ